MSRIIFDRIVTSSAGVLRTVRLNMVKLSMTRLSIAGMSVAVLTLAACSDSNTNRKAQSGQVTAVSGKATIGGSYTLVDHTGKTVTDLDFHGKAQLIYFGYAYCPDVCPTALQQMGAALTLAGHSADHYQPMFITVDSERDTPEMMAQYVTNNGFPDGLIGLTGTPEQLKQAMKAFKVIGQKVYDTDSVADYTYDHSSIIYLMDENGEFVDAFTHTTTPRQMADRLINYKKAGH